MPNSNLSDRRSTPRYNRLSLAVALALTGASLTTQAQTLPTGGQVTAGAAVISQPAANSMLVKQTSDKAALNWLSFSIGQGASVRFDQPSASSVALNRVTGGSRSEIFGSLSSNGQVFLVNPNGILFGKGAQVDVGGLVASTLAISDKDFLDGKYVFSDPANRAAVVNEGILAAKNGGYLALIGNQAVNRGEMYAHLGAVVLGAGGTARLTLSENKLVKFEVTEGALNALAENGGLIRANGGQVILTAGARDSLLASTVNNTGVIEAQTVERQPGNILLLAGMTAGTTYVGGKLDASAPGGGDGGFIETSAAHLKVKADARITTLADNGKTGTWLIDPTNFTIAAGNGAQTSSGIGATTLSDNLATGNVSIVTSAAGTEDGDIFVNADFSWSANQLTLTAERDININAVMKAKDTAALTMNTGTSGGVKVGINPDATFKGRVDFLQADGVTPRSGTGFLTINGNGYTVINSLGGEGSTTGTDLQGMRGNPAGYYALGADIDASNTSGWFVSNASGTWVGFVPIAPVFSGSFNGLGHSISNLTQFGSFNGFQTGLFGRLTGAVTNVRLSNNTTIGEFHVGGLVGYNTSSGMIANSIVTGTVNGDDTVGGLIGFNEGRISNSLATGNVDGGGGVVGGLVGSNYFGTVSNSRATGSVTGASVVGGLVGSSVYGTISNSIAEGIVNGTEDAGGLVGSSNYGTISNGMATGTVYGFYNAGGLVGKNNSSTTNSIAIGSVFGDTFVGGLMGINTGTISNSIASGLVQGNSGGSNIGGLVGRNIGPGTASNSFWNTGTSGQAVSAAGTGITTTQMMQQSTFANAGWDIASSGGSNAVWRIYEGNTAPLLRSFLTPLTLADVPSATLTYNGATQSGAATGVVNPLVLGGPASGRNAGVYNNGYYSTQQGYDLTTGGLTITPATLTVSGVTANNKVYDGTTAATLSLGGAGGLSGVIGGDNVALTGSTGVFASKDAANGISVSFSAGSLSGTDAGNYLLTPAGGALSANITKRDITAVTGIAAADKVYDGTTAATLTTSGAGIGFTGIVAGESLTVAGANGVFNDKNVAAAHTVNISGITLGNGANPAHLASNYTLTNTTASDAAVITPKTLTVGGITAANKVYDQTAAATVSVAGASLTGLIAGDAVAVNATGVFADKNAANGKTVTLTSGYTGADVGNYAITNQATTTADITPKALTVGGITASNKVYDQTTAATVNASGATYAGLISGDAVAVNATGTFSDKSAATGKTVTLTSGYTGADVSNYAITSQVSTTAGITPKALTVGGITAANKVYDQTAAATVSAAGASFTGLIAGDAVAVTATGTFADKNAATSKTVTLTSGYTGADIGNYAITDQASTIADITPKALTVSGITTANKVYDQTTAATVSVAGANLSGLIGGDAVSVNATGVFSDKNVANGKTVTLTSGYTGADVGNYTISSQGSTMADITPRSLTINATGVNKVYDGLTGATVNLSDDRISGDVLSTGYGAAGFANKNVANGKTVGVTGITLGSTDAGNYTFNTSASATADITPKALAISGITAGNKVYDQTTAATVNTGSASYTGLIGGDAVSVSATGAFSDKHAAVGKTVNLSSSYSGADAGNYTITGQSTATADITPATLTVSGLTVNNKVYDGNTAATVNTGGAVYAGLFSGDVVSVNATGAFSDKNAATGKTVTLTNGYTGADAGNYSIANQTSATADITPKAASVTANSLGKTYGSTVSFAGTEFVATGLISGETIGTVALASPGATSGAAVAGSPYAIGVSGAAGGSFNIGNYSVTYVNGNLTVNRAPLTVAANGFGKIADGVAYSGGNGVTVTGYVNGESSGVLGGVLGYSGSSQGAVSPGVYAITPGGYTAANYSIGFADGDLTIASAASTPGNSGNGGTGGDSAGVRGATHSAQRNGERVDNDDEDSARRRRGNGNGNGRAQALINIQGAGMNLPEGVD